MLKKMSIGKKLISAFMLIALVVLAAGVYQYINIKKQNDLSVLLTQENDRVDTINEVFAYSQSTNTEVLQVLHNTDQSVVKENVDKFRLEIKALVKDAASIVNGGENARGIKIHSSPNPSTISLVKAVLDATDEYSKCIESMFTATTKEEKLRLELASEKLGEKMDSNITKARQLIWDDIEKMTNDYQAVVSATMSVVVISIVISITLALAFGIFISMMITKQMNKVIHDLTEVTSGVDSGAVQINSASAQVSDSSQNIAEGANEQAASLEETSASLEQMSAMVKQNADNSKQAATMSTNANRSAQKGKEAMVKMSTAIEKIKSSSDETAKIIKTIDEIAFQTNLLALNAAVEAARAGEAGKGFAVVAEEVRNLAQRSAEAAKNTAELIEESQKNSENGVTVSSEVGGILNDIVEGIQKVGQLINEVSAATDEQSHGLEEINKAVAELDKVTQGNAANAQETASASEELSAQAAELGEHVRRLNDVVRVTRELIGGAASASNQLAYDSHSERYAQERKAIHTNIIAPNKHVPYVSDRRFNEKRHIEAVHHDETSKGRRATGTKDIIPLDEHELVHRFA